MIEERVYSVAGHCFSLSGNSGAPLWDMLIPYSRFACSCSSSHIFRLAISDFEILVDRNNDTLLCRFNEQGTEISISVDTKSRYIIEYRTSDSDSFCRVMINERFSDATAAISGDDRFCLWSVNNCIMLMYAMAASAFDTLLLHASVVVLRERGYLFLGKSGTGKSTHSRLWIEHIEGSELLNDDNPVIRIIDGRAMVFGSPWSGKTACYRNESAPIGAIVRIRQNKINQISKLNIEHAYAAVLPSCSNMKWQSQIADNIHNTVEKLISSLNLYQMDCLPNKEAAMVCSQNVIIE